MRVLITRGSWELETEYVYPGNIEFATKTPDGNYIVCGIELTAEHCAEIAEIRVTYEAVDASGKVMKSWQTKQ